ncbi:hypothetical protein HCN51_08220 [Nonomuraea sp. FMUSA5-5]|uniref:Uncharacterized protein n=1 Tax=Nonomuraea composti TaxID=2720023 RepID=A0ABX1AZG3_9ACTN|nr:hypothetical protein [Nonomuraea sp. FMUSA5-5]NJP89429.1 hypothetical protein [Nonomuraea sp. FMUSA5-5]
MHRGVREGAGARPGKARAIAGSRPARLTGRSVSKEPAGRVTGGAGAGGRVVPVPVTLGERSAHPRVVALPGRPAGPTVVAVVGPGAAKVARP